MPTKVARVGRGGGEEGKGDRRGAGIKRRKEEKSFVVLVEVDGVKQKGGGSRKTEDEKGR